MLYKIITLKKHGRCLVIKNEDRAVKIKRKSYKIAHTYTVINKYNLYITICVYDDAVDFSPRIVTSSRTMVRLYRRDIKIDMCTVSDKIRFHKYIKGDNA